MIHNDINGFERKFLMLALIALVIIFGLLTYDDVYAEGAVFIQGTDLDKNVSCTNATTREDGSALAVSEISKVEIAFTQDKTLGTTPPHFMVMTGGCQTQQLTLSLLGTNYGQWYEIGWTVANGPCIGHENETECYSKPSAATPFMWQEALPAAPARPSAPVLLK